MRTRAKTPGIPTGLLLMLALACGEGGGEAARDGGADGADGADGAIDAAPGADAGNDADVDAGQALRCGAVEAQAVPIETLAPRDTDPAIRTGDPPHRVARAQGEPSGRLLVFFPGATADPADYQDVLRHAAAGGDDALALAYVNDVRIFAVCARDDDPGCQEKLRLEILRGEDLSPHVEVGPADSILNRLTRALESLGWDRYLEAGAPAWSRLALAGHSQGSGHAAMIGRFDQADRVLLFAGTEPAPWTRQPRETPGGATFGFAHEEDPLFSAFPNSWTNLRIPGDPTRVDGADPPFGGSQQLVTGLPTSPDDENFHRSPISDGSTPRAPDGTPVYAPVWCHMLGL
ncbi:MAG: hypothetical protein AAF447_06485 [Myxococcota bacterium]